MRYRVVLLLAMVVAACILCFYGACSSSLGPGGWQGLVPGSDPPERFVCKNPAPPPPEEERQTWAWKTADAFGREHNLGEPLKRFIFKDEPGYSEAGHFNREKMEIVVFLRSSKNTPLSWCQVKYVICHELIHWLDACNGIPGRYDDHDEEFEDRMRVLGLFRYIE